jgi:ribosomal protein L7/L12
MRPSVVVALAAAAALVATLMLVVTRSVARRREHGPYPLAPPLYGTPEERIVALAQRGQKIEAIKLVREHTGLGLAEAKRVVDRAVETGYLQLPPHTRGRLDRPGPLAKLNPHLLGEAADLKRRGKAIEAIKLIREQTGLGLKEAKDVYDLL